MVLLNLFINSSTGILKAIGLHIYFSLSPYGYDVIIGNAFHILISIIIFIFAASLWRTVFEKINIVLPTKNRQDILLDSVTSIVNQNFEDFTVKLIIVDQVKFHLIPSYSMYLITKKLK